MVDGQGAPYDRSGPRALIPQHASPACGCVRTASGLRTAGKTSVRSSPLYPLASPASMYVGVASLPIQACDHSHHLLRRSAACQDQDHSRHYGRCRRDRLHGRPRRGPGPDTFCYHPILVAWNWCFGHVSHQCAPYRQPHASLRIYWLPYRRSRGCLSDRQLRSQRYAAPCRL